MRWAGLVACGLALPVLVGAGWAIGMSAFRYELVVAAVIGLPLGLLAVVAFRDH